MIVGLSGYARSGKDTVAQILVEKYGFERIAFADPIREMLVEINPILENGYRLNEHVQEFGWELAKARPEVRRLLQTLGVSARSHIDESVWVMAALRKMNDEGHYVFTDVRFKNEASAIKAMGGELWRIEREGTGPANDHISELGLDNYKFDRMLYNNSSLASLKLAVQTRMAMLTL